MQARGHTQVALKQAIADTDKYPEGTAPRRTE